MLLINPECGDIKIGGKDFAGSELRPEPDILIDIKDKKIENNNQSTLNRG